jgi:hypothetical protein
LFGAIRAFAKVYYKHWGLVIELGGPVALFCGVIYGGFKLVPQPPPTFDLAVRAHSADSPLLVYQDGKLSYFDDEQLPGPVTLKLHKPR